MLLWVSDVVTSDDDGLLYQSMLMCTIGEDGPIIAFNHVTKQGVSALQYDGTYADGILTLWFRQRLIHRLLAVKNGMSML